MTRYLLGVTFEGGVVDTPMEEWKPEEIQAHLDYYVPRGVCAFGPGACPAQMQPQRSSPSLV